MVVSGHKKGGKTKAAYRLVGLPRQFATLIRSVIAADRRLVDRPDDARAMASAGRKRSPSTPTPCSPRLAGSGHKIAETFPRLGRLVIWTAATLGHGGVVLFGAPAPIELLEHGPARQATFLPAAEVTGRSR